MYTPERQRDGEIRTKTWQNTGTHCWTLLLLVFFPSATVHLEISFSNTFSTTILMKDWIFTSWMKNQMFCCDITFMYKTWGYREKNLANSLLPHYCRKVMLALSVMSCRNKSQRLWSSCTVQHNVDCDLLCHQKCNKRSALWPTSGDCECAKLPCEL